MLRATVYVLIGVETNQLYVADAKNQWRVDVKSGEYTVELKGGNDRFVLDKDTITVTRGDEVAAAAQQQLAEVVGGIGMRGCGRGGRPARCAAPSARR